jgi:hypothetical protein
VEKSRGKVHGASALEEDLKQKLVNEPIIRSPFSLPWASWPLIPNIYVFFNKEFHN